MALSSGRHCREGRYVRIRAIVGVSLIAIICVLFTINLGVLGETVSKVVTLTIPAALKTEVDPVSLFFAIGPDASPSDTGTVQIEVCVNAPPTSFSIALVSSTAGLDFSYRLLGIGEDAVPILATVSLHSLPSLGCTNYVLDLTVTVDPVVPAGIYQDDIQLQFQIFGIIRTYVLHIETTVLPRSPDVDAGPDQTVNEGDVVAFTSSFYDPDAGESYTIAWDFGDEPGAGGTLTPTHTYVDNGTYIVTLTVTDSGGRSGQDALTVTVNDLGPTAHVESFPPVTPLLVLAVNAAEEVVFDASDSTSSPDAIFSYEWDWDYGGLAAFTPSGDTGEMGIHAFPEAGTYTVAMRVTDDDGSTDIAMLDVIVNPVTMVEPSLATPEVALGGGAVVSELTIDELYIHHQAIMVSQFHLVSREAPEQTSSPVIHFPFDEGSGEVAYNEIDKLFGREPVLKGMLSQVEWIEGEPVRGNAFALSLGEDGYVGISADRRMSFLWNQDFTLELWVRTTDASSERALVRRQRSDGGPLYGLNLFAGIPLFYLSTAVDTYAMVKGHETIVDGTWHHIACMRDAGALKLYLDGNLVDELLPEARIAGAGGSDLSSQEPTYLGGLGEAGEPMGGLVDAFYYIGEPIEFQMRLRDETGTPLTDARPLLLFIRYDNAGQQVESGFIGQLTHNPDEEQYAYSLDTSTYEEGMYDFFLVPGDGSQERLRIMLLEIG